MAVPLLWAARLVANFAVAAQGCFTRRGGDPDAWVLWLVLDLAVIAASLTGAAVAAGTHRPGATEATRFLSLWGVVVGVGFAVFTAFDLAFIVALPRCS